MAVLYENSFKKNTNCFNKCINSKCENILSIIIYLKKTKFIMKTKIYDKKTMKYHKF